MAVDLGDRLTHVHMTDGSGSRQGRAPGARPRRPAVRGAAASCWRYAASAAHVVVEINTRRADDRDAREADLAESLAFTRLHLASRREPGFVVGRTVWPSVPLRSYSQPRRWPTDRRATEAAVLRRTLLALARSERVKRLASTMPVSSGIVSRFVAGETPADAVRVARDCPLPGCGSRSTTSVRTPTTGSRPRARCGVPRGACGAGRGGAHP